MSRVWGLALGGIGGLGKRGVCRDGLCTVYKGGVSCFAGEDTVCLHGGNAGTGRVPFLFGELAHLFHVFPFFFAEEVLRMFFPPEAFVEAVFGAHTGSLVDAFFPLEYVAYSGAAVHKEYKRHDGYYLQG